MKISCGCGYLLFDGEAPSFKAIGCPKCNMIKEVKMNPCRHCGENHYEASDVIECLEAENARLHAEVERLTGAFRIYKERSESGGEILFGRLDAANLQLKKAKEFETENARLRAELADARICIEASDKRKEVWLFRFEEARKIIEEVSHSPEFKKFYYLGQEQDPCGVHAFTKKYAVSPPQNEACPTDVCPLCYHRKDDPAHGPCMSSDNRK